jgi:FAD/FMN-containing dehydrogenase
MSTASLIAELERIVGPDAVFHRPADLLVYEYDGSVEGAVDIARPIAVTLPSMTEQVAAIVRAA